MTIDLTDHVGAEKQVQSIVAQAKSLEEAKQLLQECQYHPAAKVSSVQERSDCWEVLILMPAPRTIRCEPPKGYDSYLGTTTIGAKGIAQVGETPDCEDGGILRI